MNPLQFGRYLSRFSTDSFFFHLSKGSFVFKTKAGLCDETCKNPHFHNRSCLIYGGQVGKFLFPKCAMLSFFPSTTLHLSKNVFSVLSGQISCFSEFGGFLGVRPSVLLLISRLVLVSCYRGIEQHRKDD